MGIGAGTGGVAVGEEGREGAPAPASGEAVDIRLVGVHKSYGDVVAVDSVDLEIRHGEFFDVWDAPLPSPDTPAPPRFLAPFDNAVLAHADRSRIVADEDREVLMRDRLMRTFLVDGFVAGTWELRGETLHVRPKRPLTLPAQRALTSEAEQLLAFLAPGGSAGRVLLHPAQ